MSPMWVLVVLLALLIVAALNFLRIVVKLAAWWLTIALRGTIANGAVSVTFPAWKRRTNGFAALFAAVIFPALTVRFLVSVAALLSQAGLH